MNLHDNTQSLQPLTQEEKQEHLRDEAVIQEFMFEARKCFAALLRIKERRSYRDTYSTFEKYVEVKWGALYGDMSRMNLWRHMKHEETIQAVEAENVTRALQIEPPTSIRQSEALASLPPNERPYALEIARETYGVKPTGAEVATTVAVLTGREATHDRISRLDLDAGPQNGKWIDATGGTHEGIANMPNPVAERKERFTEDIRCDGHRLHYQLVVKRGNGQSPLKWYGFISRKQWESAGFSYHGKAQHAMDEEDFTESTPAAPAETNGNGATRMDAGVREKLIAEKKRLEAIGAHVLFAGKLADEDAADFAEDDPPTAGSFIAGADLSYADAPTDNIALDAMNKMFEDDYPQ